MKRSSYYIAGLLLFTAYASNVCGERMIVKNQTTSDIKVEMKGSVKGQYGCGDMFWLQPGEESNTGRGFHSKCSLIEVSAMIRHSPTSQTVAKAWTGNLIGYATFAVKSDGKNGYEVVKE